MENKTIVKSVSKESLLLLIGIIVFALFISIMGATNTFKTMMATAHDLILNTSFFIMGLPYWQVLFLPYYPNLELSQ